MRTTFIDKLRGYMNTKRLPRVALATEFSPEPPMPPVCVRCRDNKDCTYMRTRTGPAANYCAICHT